MAGLGAKDILRNISALEQLIEEINFQRAKEMRQCLMSKDSDSSFVIVQGTTYWTDLFVRHFLFQTDRSTDADDLLFFIRKKHIKGSRYVPKYQTEVEVYRKDSRKLPIGDPDIDWEETVYLNLIIHQFEYTLTLAVCTRTSPKELQVLRRHSQKVYASPSRRRMDTKGEVEEITYPNVCFHVDNFDEVFADMLVRDGEMVCVELVAADYSGSRQAVIFLGSIRYEALKRVYDARASLSSKVAQRMMLGLFSGGGGAQRIEFVRMKGPQGKGHAEMAVTKPKGSGVETPSSEPGVSLTDLWDPDWEDEPEDRFMYAHQRRLSDPSANFNTFINSGWRTRSDGGRSRSENEGLDSFADGLYEIESGDVRDAVCSDRCCAVVPCSKLPPDEVFSEGNCSKCNRFHGKQEDVCISDQPHSPNNDAPKEPGEDSPLLGRSSTRDGMELRAVNDQHDDQPPEESHSLLQQDEVTEGGFVKIVQPRFEEQLLSHLKTKLSCSDGTISKGPGKAVRVSENQSPKRYTFPMTSECPPLKDLDKEDAEKIAVHALRHKPKKLRYKVVNVPAGRFTTGKEPSGTPGEDLKLEVPYRTTRDGTKVYFLCNFQLDDGSYNPLWTTRGFTQTFHFWKENKRQTSVPLNAYLTYVTLPWFTIITDILDHRTGPILTF